MVPHSPPARCPKVLVVLALALLVPCLAGDARDAPSPENPVAGAPPLSPAQAVRIATTHLEETDDGLWLRHPAYTARFNDAGVTFLPGGDAPRWRWRLEAVETTEGLLAAVDSTRIAPAGSPVQRTVRYDRGGIVEQYLPEQDGLEQSFVVPRPLELRGEDLVITGAVRCTGAFGRHARGWAWRQAGQQVSLGDVYAYDAQGDALPASMSVTATTTRIVVDGKALARAVHPVIIDPRIGTGDVRISDMGPDGDRGYDAYRPAVAYNSTDGEYLVVWEGDDDTGLLGDYEPEIFGQRINAATGAEVGANDFRISDMGTDDDAYYEGAGYPAVAYNSVDNEYLVVWEGNDATGTLALTEKEIFGQRINAATGAEVGANDFRISDMGPDGDGKYGGYRPAVAHSSTGDEYLVVWQGLDDSGSLADYESEIFGQYLNAVTGAELGTNDFRISDMGPDGNRDYDAFHPAVAYNSTDDEFLVVWEGDDSLGLLADDEFEVYGQRLDAYSGLPVGANDFRISDIGPDGNASYDATDPDVAYNSADGQYLVVWQADRYDGSPSYGEHEIFGQRINAATGAQIGANDFRISDMGPDGDGGFQALAPALVYNSTVGEFLVTWRGVDDLGFPGVYEYEVYGQRINAATGAQIGANDFRISHLGPDGNNLYGVAFASAIAHSTLNDQVLVVYDGSDDAGSLVDGEYEIYGTRFRRDPAAPPSPAALNLLLLGP